MEQHIHKSVSVAMQIEGMTSQEGLTLMGAFLRKVLSFYNSGICLEFGTYKGRTSALIAANLGKQHWLHSVDQAEYLELEKLHEISSSVTWHKGHSEEFCQVILPEILGDQKVLFSHHDASHFFSNVYIEISNVIKYLEAYGIMVLDDFNDNFSQVRAAYYYLRYAESFPYELLLVGFNKAVLVHEDMFDYWESYVLDDLLEEMSENGVLCKLIRSDVNEHSRSFFMRTRKESEDIFYGLKFWGDRFYKKSSTILRR